ncbi:MAG TPA: hypothetical protein PLJ47_14845 [Candidatus Hydrogenedentes bacterium]|nr:hypothetical protein [Candidatus Hydrogenedentota bacterium]HRK35873.1 hypothetical protein [Candidatus Hydrogenedentota bacterium]
MKKLAMFAAVVMFGVVAASAGTLGVASFSDGGGATGTNLFPTSLAATFLALKNNQSTTSTYTVLYFGLDGTNRTPAANTFTVAGNAARGWRPVATDPNEGVGSTVPNATGTAGAGTASILYTDAVAPSGAVRIFVGGVNSAYAFSMIP